MGMDVFGKQPSADCGRYFRASIWMWAPLLEHMHASCRDLLGEELLESLSYNDGKGPDDQATCTELADRFERGLAQYPSGFELESDDVRVNAEGRFVLCDPAGPKPEKTVSPFRIAGEEIAEWIAFLRHCGGFAVW